MNAYGRILSSIYSQVWAIQPAKLQEAVGLLELMATGKMSDAEGMASLKAVFGVQAARPQIVNPGSPSAIAVLPLYGCIMQRGSWWCYGTSVQEFKQQLRLAVNDASIKAVIIDVDSPGGTVAGVDEFAGEIFAARKLKKIIAVSNCQNASAAYYLSSNATEIVASPSSQTGSVGVYMAHEDDSELLQKLGVKVTLISYGANKTNGNPYEPLSPEGRAEMQKTVNAYGAMFDKAVARGRKIPAAKVKDTYGQGLMFTAADALAIGMVDRIGTLDDVLAQYGVSPGGGTRTTMNMSADSPQAAVAAGAACQCGCESCVDGDCDGCTVDDCANEGCTCAAAMKNTEASASAHAYRARELQLAAL